MKKQFAPLGILLFVCCLFFWPIFKGFLPFPGDLLIDSNPYRSLSVLGYGPGAYPNKAQGQDVITETYPWRYFTIQELKQGRIPFWNPHNFSGNILMQNLQSSVFNPFNIIFFMLPFTKAWTLFILIQPILASFFFYFFARELKVSRFAGVLGAIGFAFSSYMTVWIEYGNIAATLAYLPLLLFFMLRFLKKQKTTDYVGFAVASLIMLLSGYIQGAFYSYLVVLLFSVGYFLTNKLKLSPRLILSFVGMMLFPLCMSAFQYLPTLQIFSQSSRSPYTILQFQTLLQPVWYWITLFASDFFGNPATRNYYLPITYIERVAYIGVPLFFFALFAINKRKKVTAFFVVFALIILLLTTNLPGVVYLYSLKIPVINTTVPTRFLSIFMFCMVVLATMGIDVFFIERKIPKKLVSIFLAIYSLLWIGVFASKHFFPQYAVQISTTEHNLIIPTILIIGVFLVLFLTKKYQTMAKGLLFVLVVADLLYVFQKITPFAPEQMAYPQTPPITYLQQHAGINRFWGYGSGYVAPNFQTVDMTYSPEGNDPLHMKSYGELLASSYDGKIPQLPPRPDANLASGFGSDGMKNQYRQTLLNLLGVKYILQHDEARRDNDGDVQIFPKETYALAWSQNPWQIYENKDVLPRYFLVNTFIVAKGQDALNKIYSMDIAKTVVLDMSPTLSIDKNATGSVKMIHYDPQKIVFSSQTTGTMLLFLSDTFYQSWNVKIDTNPSQLYLADYAFRAVVVPAGKHTITMYYSSKSFSLGILIAGISFVVFLLSIFLLKKHESKN